MAMTIEEYNNSVDKFADGLYRFALKSLGNIEEAEDAVQDAFEKLWIKREEASFEKVKSYMYTIVYHSIIDRSRKIKRFHDFQELPFDDVQHTTDNFDLKRQLERALQLLPTYQRNVVLLRDYEGYTYQEIGEITNLTTQQVKVYIFRARKSLRTYLNCLEQHI
jgi:RNA polymerase sigma factor (sigma-70 family)